MNPPRRNSHEVGEASVRAGTDPGPFGAQVHVSPHAERTRAAEPGVRLGRHTQPQREPFDALPDLGHGPSQLVAENPRGLDRQGPLRDVEIRPAQSADRRADDDLTRTCVRLRDLPDGQVAGAGAGLDERFQPGLPPISTELAALSSPISLYCRVVSMTARSVGTRSPLDPAAYPTASEWAIE